MKNATIKQFVEWCHENQHITQFDENLAQTPSKRRLGGVSELFFVDLIAP